jgi:hypothetical protein
MSYIADTVMPPGTTEIHSCEGIDYRDHKLIGHWKRLKTDKDGRLIGMTTVDGVEMSVRRDRIKTKGYRDWLSVCYMDSESDRRICAAHVYQKIKEGIIKRA